MISNKIYTLKILGLKKGKNISEQLNHLKEFLIVERAKLKSLSSIKKYCMKIEIKAALLIN